MKRYLQPLIQRRTYLATLDLLLDLPFGILWFTFFTTVTSIGFGMVITLIGIPILTFAMLAARFAGTVERRRVHLFHGVEIGEPTRPTRRNDGLLERVIAPLRDSSTYRDLLYVWLVQPVLGLFNFVAAVVAWSIPLWLITLPLYAITWEDSAPELGTGHRLNSWGKFCRSRSSGSSCSLSRPGPRAPSLDSTSRSPARC
jgi:hypothetical protein